MSEKDVLEQTPETEMSSAEESSTSQPEAAILRILNEEHNYLSRLILVVKEQLSAFEIGKDPHYALMHDIVSFVGEFDQRYKYKVKDRMVAAIIDKAPEANSALEELMAEQNQLESLRQTVVSSLKSLMKEDTILKREQLRIFTADYIELLEAHIETEADILPRQIRSVLSVEEIEQFAEEYSEDGHEEGFAAAIEDSYKHLYDRLSRQIEEAANEFAMSDFASMRHFVENLQPFNDGAKSISKIIKDYSYKLYLANYECYKELLTNSQENKLDYINKPVDCFKTCFDDYREGLSEISGAMKETREKLGESSPKLHVFKSSGTKSDKQENVSS